MECKLLRPYRGFKIEKSWETLTDGTIRKDTIIYAAYTIDEDLFDTDETLKSLKRKIDRYAE